ncbi:hypothetical protein [Streptomyces cucumeris]|uniref:hypothetical protein n=1 Tax=Streptomyces cucumeris TaxID=2962890 RepID=UPI0020C8C91F|nr:hypothetical protein [Streptomyces sp. NEAU-Y11]MCP9209515.1 hypothetical protein [Streptomyces sp. NEAU-Y11]
MEQGWQVTVVATGPSSLPTDDQFEALHKRLKGVIRHDADTGRLTMVWRVMAPTAWQAAEVASLRADNALRLDLDGEPEVKQVHVVVAEEVEVPDELKRFLGTTATLWVGAPCAGRRSQWAPYILSQLDPRRV